LSESLKVNFYIQ